MDGLLKSTNGYWQDLSDADKFKHIFDTGYLVDCKFLVGPDEETAEIIEGHRLMFITSSPVFEKMLTGQYAEAKANSEIRINDAYSQDFKNFRYMIYNNHSELSHLCVEEIIALYRLCDKYIVSAMAQKCIIHLKKILNQTNTNVDDIFSIYKFAFQLEDKFFFVDVKTILKYKTLLPDYKLCEFSEQEFYEYILNIVNTDTQSLLIFSAVNVYLTKLFTLEDEHNKNLNESLDENNSSAYMMEKNFTKYISLRRRLLNLINFNSMTPQEFIAGPGQSRILSVSQKFDMLSMKSNRISIVNNF